VGATGERWQQHLRTSKSQTLKRKRKNWATQRGGNSLGFESLTVVDYAIPKGNTSTSKKDNTKPKRKSNVSMRIEREHQTKKIARNGRGLLVTNKDDKTRATEKSQKYERGGDNKTTTLERRGEKKSLIKGVYLGQSARKSKSKAPAESRRTRNRNGKKGKTLGPRE